LYRETYELQLGIYGGKHIETLTTMSHFSKLLLDQENFAESAKLYQIVIENLKNLNSYNK
jgi:hypothetical protein